MPLLRKLNRFLLFTLILMVCALLYSKFQRALPPPSLKGAEHRVRKERLSVTEKTSEEESVIPVLICAAEERMGGTMATINSVFSNTDANLLFYIVTLRDAVQHLKEYIRRSQLNGIKFKILEFNPTVLKGRVRPDSSRPELLHPLNFARFYLPVLVGKHRRVIYLDDDVIVQGDIQELYQMELEPGHAAAFASDCDLPPSHETVRSVGMQTSYMGFLDYRKQEMRELGINPNECSFNPGVFVADTEEWKHQRITRQLEKWMQKNLEDNIYSTGVAGGVATPPMLIVFHKKHSVISPQWHIRHLGWSPDTRYTDAVLQEAQLLHWNGKFKPWDYPSVHKEYWEKWYIPDPTGKFLVVRPES